MDIIYLYKAISSPFVLTPGSGHCLLSLTCPPVDKVDHLAARELNNNFPAGVVDQVNTINADLWFSQK